MKHRTDREILTILLKVQLRKKFGCFNNIQKALQTKEGQFFVIETEQALTYKTIGI